MDATSESTLIIGAANLCSIPVHACNPPALEGRGGRVQTEESARLQMSQVFCQMPPETPSHEFIHVHRKRASHRVCSSCPAHDDESRCSFAVFLAHHSSSQSGGRTRDQQIVERPRDQLVLLCSLLPLGLPVSERRVSDGAKLKRPADPRDEVSCPK